MLAAFAAGAGILFLAYVTPLTFDEAFSRMHYRQLGIPKTLQTYDYPNNHVPFTVLQLLIPQRLLAWNPWTIRIVSVLCGITLVSLVIMLGYLRRASPFLVMFAILGSPIVSSYLFLARGYSFSALWLVVAAAVPAILGRARPLPIWGASVAALALAMATWPLPINVLFAPGWIAGVWAFWGGAAALSGAAVYVVTTALLLVPILGQIQDSAERTWNGNPHFWPWLGDIVFALNLVPACLIAVVVVASTALARQRRTATGPGGRTLELGSRLAVLAGAMSMSWFLVLALAHAAGGLIELPFARTAVPAMWLLVVALIGAVPRGRGELFATTLLLPGALWGCAIWSSAVLDGNWRSLAHASRTDVFYETTPRTIRDLSRVGADQISCPTWNHWVCRLVAPNLRRSGISVVETTTVPDVTRCAVGSRRPPSRWGVTVYDDGRLLGILCD